MKKVLSIILATMMLLSLFAMNASAIISTTEDVVVVPAIPQVDVVTQDYSDVENNLDFLNTFGGLGTETLTVDPVDETNPVMKLSGEKGMIQSVVTKDALADDQRVMNVEFRVYPIGQAETVSVGVRMPALLAGTQGKDNYYMIGHPNFAANQWNTVKVEFHIPEGYNATNASYPEYGNESSATITVNGNVLACVPGSAGKTAAEGKYGVLPNFAGATKPTEITELVYIGVGGLASLDVPEGGREILLDDIKAYIPEVPAVTEEVAYPLSKGNLYFTSTEEYQYEGYDGSTAKEKGKFALQSGLDAGNYVLTIDLKNPVPGVPLTIHFGDGVRVGAANFANSALVGNDWNTFKIPFRADGDLYFSPQAVYRVNADGSYTKLEYATDWRNTRSGSSRKNELIFFYRNEMLTKLPAPENADVENTLWEVRNVQLADAYAFTGKASVADELLTINLNTAMFGDAVIYAVVYDGDRMVSATPVEQAISSETATITVSYPESVVDPSVKLFVWDDMGTMVPVDVPADITSVID